MKKTRLIVIICVILVSGVSGFICGNDCRDAKTEENRHYTEHMVEYQGFDDILDAADEIVKGTLCSVTSEEDYEEYLVDVEQCIKGQELEQIKVRNYYYNYSYLHEGAEYSGSTNTDYKVGDTYVFVLQHISNVYEEQYVILADTYLNVDEGTVSSLSQELDEDYNYEYIEHYEYKNSNGSGNTLSIPYTTEEALPEIVRASQYIADIEVKELYDDTAVTDIYVCLVREVLKGEVTTTEEQRILIPFFKGQVDTGDEVIVMLNSDTEGALIYTLSSANSVRDIEEKASVCNIIRTGGTE